MELLHAIHCGPVGRGRWVVHGVVLIVVAALASGCNKSTQASPRPAASTGAVAAPGSSAAGVGQAASSGAASEYKEAHFDLKIEPRGSYKSGQAGQVQIVLQAKPPFHCNDKYPYKFKLKESKGVTYPESIVKKDSVKLEKCRATMTVGFTPDSPGRKTIAGQFLFSVCAINKCLVERRNLTLDINVQ